MLFKELLPVLWIRPATWLFFVHEIADSISHSPADEVNHSEFMTSPVYVRYTYEHGHHMAIKRMHKQCVPGALSSPSSAPGNEANWSSPLNCVLTLQMQYVFIHDALEELITCGETDISAGNMRMKMNRLHKIVPGKAISGFEDQFKVRCGDGN